MPERAIHIDTFKEYRKEGYSIIDLRPTETFARGFVPGSVNIPLGKSFDMIADLLVFKNQHILLVSAPGQGKEGYEELVKKGFTNILGYLDGGFEHWQNAGEQVDLVISISTGELELEIYHGDLFLIDIREKNAYEVQHVKNSLNFEPEVLIDNYDRIDEAITNCIFCANGEISMSLISFLKFHGKHNIYHVSGGFGKIRQNKGVPFETPKKKDVRKPVKDNPVN